MEQAFNLLKTGFGLPTWKPYIYTHIIECLIMNKRIAMVGNNNNKKDFTHMTLPIKSFKA